jgi:hypothetical protein
MTAGEIDPRVRPLLAPGRRRRGLRPRAHDRRSARPSGWGRGGAPPTSRRRSRGDRPASVHDQDMTCA